MERVCLLLVIRDRSLSVGWPFLTYSLLNKLTFTLNSIFVPICILSYVKQRTFLAKGLSPHSGAFPSPSMQITISPYMLYLRDTECHCQDTVILIPLQ